MDSDTHLIFFNSYKPRHVIIFRSSALYHEVTEWTPAIMKREDIFTPGRAAYVYFTHQNVVDLLKDKPIGWFEKTGCGEFSTGVLPVESCEL